MSGFVLDRFEVTVGRFRKFVEEYPGSRPPAGAGRLQLIDGSGWNEDWDGNLPADAAALKAAMKCEPSYQTWTDEAGEREHLPMTCLSWYEAFAFCAWDGGRLPTEAEWNYAAAGGDQQRMYAWSDSTMVDYTFAVYDCAGDGSASSCTLSDIQPVGSRSPKGDGRWGQADLSGNMWEWVLDWYADYSMTCNDCANLEPASSRVFRGGIWSNNASYLLSSNRVHSAPSERSIYVGVRCARTQ